MHDAPKTPGIFMRWAAVLAWAILIHLVSSIPEPPDPGIAVPHLDKAAHLVEYAIFAILLKRAALPGSAASWSQVMTLVSLVVLYGIVEEWHQGMVGRTPEALDVLADAAGACIGVYAGNRRIHGPQGKSPP